MEGNDGSTFYHPPLNVTKNRIIPFIQRGLTVTLVLGVPNPETIHTGKVIGNGQLSKVSKHVERLSQSLSQYAPYQTDDCDPVGCVTGIMVDYEPTSNYTLAHVHAYSSFLSKLGRELYLHGNLQLDMCISNWGILQYYGEYVHTTTNQITGMMSMGSTYYGRNITSNMETIHEEIQQGISPDCSCSSHNSNNDRHLRSKRCHQLRVGIGSTNAIWQKWDYQWTPSKLRKFIHFLNANHIHHIAVWRTDIDSINATDGTTQWLCDEITSFLSTNSHNQSGSLVAVD